MLRKHASYFSAKSRIWFSDAVSVVATFIHTNGIRVFAIRDPMCMLCLAGWDLLSVRKKESN